MDSVASRYAIALLEVAREEKKVKEYVDEVSNIASIIDGNKDLQLLLKDYGLKVDEKKETVDLCFKGKINEYILNMFYVLLDNKRGAYILEVCNEFVRIGLNELNEKHGVVYSTINLTAKEVNDISKKVSKLLNSNVILENKIDNSLIGGFKVVVGDYVIDDSFKTRLEKIKQNLLEKKGENN